jgi:hypothetical protein
MPTVSYRILVIFLCFVACTTPSQREADIARVRAHLSRVEVELAARDVSHLTSDQREQRATLLARLHDYTEAERYPSNDVVLYRTPIFIDDQGVRCAMAYLIESTGDAALVERIARTEDYAYIADLANDPELEQWLVDHGISLAEAAQIQPGYSNATAVSWVPTVSIVTGAQAGALLVKADSANAWLPAGVRVGARRLNRSRSPCDQCVYQTTAFFAEYQYLAVPGTGHADQLGLFVQRDLNSQAQDHQRYLVAGALFSAGTGPLHDGVGAEAGYGMSLRRRDVPVFGELIAAALTAPGGASIRVGLDVGLVW